LENNPKLLLTGENWGALCEDFFTCHRAKKNLWYDTKHLLSATVKALAAENFELKGIVSRDFGGLQMIVIDRA